MRISDWSSDVCSSDLRQAGIEHAFALAEGRRRVRIAHLLRRRRTGNRGKRHRGDPKTKCPRPHSNIVHLEKFPPIDWFRSEEHTSELQSLMRISYAVFCLKNKKNNKLKMKTHIVN